MSGWELNSACTCVGQRNKQGQPICGRHCPTLPLSKLQKGKSMKYHVFALGLAAAVLSGQAQAQRVTAESFSNGGHASSTARGYGNTDLRSYSAASNGGQARLLHAHQLWLGVAV